MVGLAPAGEVSPSGTLGAYIAGPLVALGLVILAVSFLPGAECGGDNDGSSLARTELILATVIASLTTGAAALWRLRELHGAGRPLAGPGALALCAFVLFVVLTEVLVPQVRELIWLALMAGVLATGVLLVMLAIAWLSGRDVDQVGILLPAYLLGASLSCYPFLAMFALAVNNGAFC